MPKLFAPGPAAPAPASGLPNACSDVLLDAEKLQVYRLAVQFQTLATQLIPRQRGLLLATLRDQLDRASISIVLNIARARVASFHPTRRVSTNRSRQRHRVRCSPRPSARPPSGGPAALRRGPQPDRPHRPNADAASRPDGHDARCAQRHVRVSMVATRYGRG